MVIRRIRVQVPLQLGGGLAAYAARTPAPIRARTLSVPAHSFRLYNEERGLPAAEPATRENPETPVRILKTRTRYAALQDYQLLPEAQIVCDQHRLWLDSRNKLPQQTAKHYLSIVNHQEADAVQCRK